MISNEMKKIVMEVGLELYNQHVIKKLKPSFYQLVKTLDGRISRNTVSVALDVLEDIGHVRRSIETKYQPGLTSEGKGFFGPIYQKVIKT